MEREILIIAGDPTDTQLGERAALHAFLEAMELEPTVTVDGLPVSKVELSAADKRALEELTAYVEGRATAVEAMSAAAARHIKARLDKVARKQARKRAKQARRKNRGRS